MGAPPPGCLTVNVCGNFCAGFVDIDSSDYQYNFVGCFATRPLICIDHNCNGTSCNNTECKFLIRTATTMIDINVRTRKNFIIGPQPCNPVPCPWVGCLPTPGPVTLTNMCITIVRQDFDIESGSCITLCNVNVTALRECFHLDFGSSTTTITNSHFQIQGGFHFTPAACETICLTFGTGFTMCVVGEHNDETHSGNLLWGGRPNGCGGCRNPCCTGTSQVNFDDGAVITIHQNPICNNRHYVPGLGGMAHWSQCECGEAILFPNTILELDGGTLEGCMPLQLNTGAIIRGDYGLLDVDTIRLNGGTFGDDDPFDECLRVSGNLTVGTSNTIQINFAGGVILESDTTITDTAINMTLNGGSFSTARVGQAGYDSVKMDTLTLQSSSSISLGTGPHDLAFQNFSGINVGAQLSVFGWSNNAGVLQGGQLFVDNAPSATQLANIWFEGYGLGAAWVGNEIVPVNIPGFTPVALFAGHACFPALAIPEASTWWGASGVVAFAFMHYVRRRRKEGC